MNLPGQDILSQMVFGAYARTMFAAHINSRLKPGSPRGLHKITYKFPAGRGVVGGQVCTNLQRFGIRTCIARAAAIQRDGLKHGAFYTSKSRAFEADRHTRVFLAQIDGEVTSSPVRKGNTDSAQDAASGKEWKAWGVPTQSQDPLGGLHSSIGESMGYTIPGRRKSQRDKWRQRRRGKRA